MKVRNPRTGEFDYEFTPITSHELVDKTSAMREAQIDWCAESVQYRIDTLKLWKLLVEEQKESLYEALATDTGRKAETMLEIDFFLKSIDQWCELAPLFFVKSEKKQTSISSIEEETTLVPHALISVISPATFPLLYAVIDAIPALLAGCAVIVKPSELTPRFTDFLTNSLVEFPHLEPVFSFILGDSATAITLTQLSDKVCFTGARQTAKEILKIANDNLLPVDVELKGKNIAIVSETAEIERATSAILWGSAFNAGQSCHSIERIYVHRNIYHQFLSRLVGKANLLEFAFPNIEHGQIGPVISEKQVKIINDLLTDALNKGAEIKAGARNCKALGGGYYCRPTVLTNVTEDMNIITDEHLAPLLPVIPFLNLDDAIILANKTELRGNAAVFAQDDIEAMQIANELKFNTISLNDVSLNFLIPEVKSDRFNKFLKRKVLLMSNQDQKSDWWY